MNKVVLRFLTRHGVPSLDRVSFFSVMLDRTIESSRTTFAPSNPIGVFRWTAGVRALSALLLRHGMRRFALCSHVKPFLEGERGSLAATLDYAIAKRNDWLIEMFGARKDGKPFIRYLIARTNPERKRPGSTIVEVKDSMLSSDAVEVYCDGGLITDPIEWERLLQLVEAQQVQSAARNENSTDTLTFRDGPKTIALISPAAGVKPFYIEVLEQAVRTCLNFPSRGYSVVPILPCVNFNASSSDIILQEIASGKRSFDGVIIISDDPDRQHESIIRCYAQGKYPVVMFDVDFGNRREFGEHGHLPPFVGGDEQAGGEIAAGILIAHLTTQKVVAPRVVILRGRETEWESRRYRSFMASMRSVFPDVFFVVSEPLDYDRSLARVATRESSLALSVDGKLGIDAIFSCNDDMALGARNAITQLQREGLITRPHFGILGYDGVKEMCDCLDNGDDLLLGTVDVQIEVQVSECLRIMRLMIGGHGVFSDTSVLVKPLAYYRSNQSLHSQEVINER